MKDERFMTLKQFYVTRRTLYSSTPWAKVLYLSKNKGVAVICCSTLCYVVQVSYCEITLTNIKIFAENPINRRQCKQCVMAVISGA